MGFTWLPVLPREPVSSYLTLSPLPSHVEGGLLSAALAVGYPPGCYPASCPVEFGLSSRAFRAGGRLAPPDNARYIPGA